MIGGLLVLFFVTGCKTDDGNSPDMGKVAPKPNPNMNAQLPPRIRDQIAGAKLGADAQQMQHMKRP